MAKTPAKPATTKAPVVRKTTAARNGVTKSVPVKSSSKPTNAVKHTRKELLGWYESMLGQRRFEEKAGQMYGMQKIKGFCHLYIGQEAVSTGVEAVIRPDDYVITAYRDHGQALARGMNMRECMAELFGKIGGCSKGKGGSMHFFSKELNFLGGHGIVGGQIPMGTGVAFGIQYKGGDQVCVTYFGDGATRQGAMHEAFNLAMLWKLPVLYIIENNFYAMGTSVERTSNVTELYTLGESYDMPSEPVDAMNIFEVYEKVSRAVEHIRAGKGPYLLEMKTYRYRGHSMSDPAKYRTKEELEKYKDQDPIARLSHYMLENKLATAEDLDAIETKINAAVTDCVEFAEASPFPEAHELYQDVYYGNNYPFIREGQ